MIPGLISNIADVLVSRGWLPDAKVALPKIDEAVKAFQNHFGLTPDGALTDETIATINAPRFCGLPDVMPLQMGAVNLCRWPDGNVAYFVHHAFPGLTMEETWQTFDWAMDQWADVCGLKVNRANNPAGARIVARVKRLDGPNGVLAQSELPCGNISTANQEYDSSEAWNRSIQAKLVVLHELGHALGIPHIGTGNVMAPIYNGTLNAPQAGDIAEGVKRYGPPLTPPVPVPPTPGVGHMDVDWHNKRVTVFGETGWTIEVR